MSSVNKSFMGYRKFPYRKNLGRIYYLKYIFDTLIIKYLSYLSRKHIENNNPQVSILSFDGIGTTINVRGIYELEQLTTTIEWLNREKLVNGSAIDVGANIGNHSLFFSKYYDHVYSFEPVARTFKSLEINSQPAKNVKTYNFGISDSNGVALMQTCRENMGASRIVDIFDEDSKGEKIIIKTLDSMINEFNEPIGLIKIDVEGHEISALKGAKNVIAIHKPVILFEQHLYDFKDGVSPIVEFLELLGYRDFATVMPSPYMPLWMPKIIRAPVTAITRLILGFSFSISIRRSITPDFYTFIIAIPDKKNSVVGMGG